MPKDSSASAAIAACIPLARGRYRYQYLPNGTAFNLKFEQAAVVQPTASPLRQSAFLSGTHASVSPPPALSASNIVRAFNALESKTSKAITRNINNLRRGSLKRSTLPFHPLSTTANESVTASAERLGLLNYKHLPRKGKCPGLHGGSSK